MKKAAEKFNQRIENQSNQANKIVEQLDKLYDQAKYEEVIHFCDQYATKLPVLKTRFLYYKALSLDHREKSEEAKTIMKEILKLEPLHSGARAWLAGNEFDRLFNVEGNKCSPELLQKIENYAAQLANNKSMIGSINEMCDKLNGYMDASRSAIKYQEIFKKEQMKKAENNSYTIDSSALKGVMNQILNNEDKVKELKNLEEKVKLLQKTNPEDYTKFSKLFHFLVRLEEIEKKSENQLKKIAEIIGIKYEYLQFYITLFDKLKESDENETEKNQPNNIKIDTDYPRFKKATFDRTCKPLGQVLHELVLDMKEYQQADLSEETIQEYLNLEENNFNSALSLYKSKFNSKVELINSYEQVRRHYSNWENKQPTDIRNWANGCKGNLSNVYEAIGVMDRANELITGGHRLRHSQVISLLIYCSKQEGKLLQIGTGEGKTLIISLFVAIRVLQGETVDVITSNTVLAEEGAKERKKFYNLLGLKVATNNPVQIIDKDNKPYKADILYGSISNFQFDYLRDSFECMKTRCKRKFETVMIDEVDSMLIDNGGHIAKLSGPLPGMDSLRYIYLNIWIEIAREHEIASAAHKKKLQDKFNELMNAANVESNLEMKFLDFEKSELDLFTKQIKEKVKKSINLSENKLIPKHISEYASKKLETWIDNAIYAKYYSHKDKQYLIKKKNDKDEKDANNEDVIVPIDYENTGVTLKNTIWSNGLHQFVQLKHNLYLTSESLTTSFISNIGYIRKYKNIFGLSGTLGSGAEQDLISSAYNIKFAKIPTFKKKKFKELDLLCVKDSNLSAKIVVETIEQCENGRAVLIICETINDLDKIENDFKLFKKIFNDIQFNVNTFRDEDESKITQKVLQPGDVIISTNIAGRGTDFKTAPELETNGGLHVIVTFCPTNKRVEDQAFGRTSRQGKSGTAQIIHSFDEIFNSLGGGKIIKEIRDKNETARINDIKNVKLDEIDYNDKLFGYFSEVYVKLYLKHKNDPVYPYFLSDLKEFWAFWLEKNNNGKGKKLSQAEADFNQFKFEANEIINGKIRHNPYYMIKQAKQLIDQDELDKAEKTLNEAISIGNSSIILYSAYFKLFEISILKGNQLTERFVKIMANTIFIPYTKDESYKEKARDNLIKAESALKIEIDQIDSLFNDKISLELLLIEEKQKNIFIKHLTSRHACLTFYLNNLIELKKQLESEEGLILDKKIPNYLSTLEKAEKEKFQILNAEIYEIESAGLNELYSLKKVNDVPEIKLNRAIAQIAGGIGALAIGIAFPPAMLVCGPCAACLISEGVCDIVLELISNGEEEYSEKEYAKTKITSYGISIATMGLGAIASSIKILNKASKACQAISVALQKSPFLKSIFNKVADKIAKLGEYFNKLKLAKISQNMNKLSLSRKELFKLTVKDVAIETTKNAVSGGIEIKITKPLFQNILISLKPSIKTKVKECIEKHEVKNKITLQSKKDHINELTEQILEGDITQIATDCAKDITLGVLKSSDHSTIKNVALLINTVVDFSKITNYTNNFCNSLNERLNEEEKYEEKRLKYEEVNQLINTLADKLTEKIFSLIVELGGKFTDRFIKDPLLDKAANSFKKDKDNDPGNKIALFERINENHSRLHRNNTEYINALNTLGLKSGATFEMIRKAYRNNLLIYHPDKGGSVEAFNKILNSYDLLTKP